MAHKSYLLALCAVLPACATTGAPADAPARLSAQSPEAHAEIAQTIAAALHRDQVRIAADAFARDSSILVEPARLEGRETRPPERFSLIKRGRQCFLKRETTSEEWALKQARCAEK